MQVLLFNAGSSSLKATLMESAGEAVVASGTAEWSGAMTRYKYVGPGGTGHAEDVRWKGHAQAVRCFVSDLTGTEPVVLPDRSALAAVGHRVVHGGRFVSSVRVTPDIRSRITALADLAPLH